MIIMIRVDYDQATGTARVVVGDDEGPLVHSGPLTAQEDVVSKVTQYAHELAGLLDEAGMIKREVAA